MVLEDIKLVKQGKVATLGKLYDSDIPFFRARGWVMNIPGTPTGGPFGSNQLVFHDELVTTQIGQVEPSSTARVISACGLRRATTSTMAGSVKRRTSAAPAT
jgi:hypothetical protein